MKKEMHAIEQKVFSFLKQVFPLCGREVPHILAAVSGGSDSIVLLTVLNRLRTYVPFALSAVTVNHNIRPAAETDGDASFAASYCGALGIPCAVAVLPAGAVRQLADSGGGIEDAARQLRYDAFEREALRIGADFIALGHNQNDQLETVVMRFLQGAGSLGGIRQVRLPYIRPLLEVPRTEIDAYLSGHSLESRFDATNADETYLRNRIRNSLLPGLSALVPGWQKSVLTLAEKMQDDDDFIRRVAADVPVSVRQSADGKPLYAVFNREDAGSLAPAVLLRFLQRVCILLQTGHRLPYRHFCRMRNAVLSGQNVAGCGLFLQRAGHRFFMGKDIVQSYKTGYLINVSHGAAIETPYFTVQCGSAAAGYPAFQVPSGGIVAIRSAVAEDAVHFSNGKKLAVKSFFANEHIPVFLRKEIPVVVYNGLPVCFAGSVFGFADVCSENVCRISAADPFPSPFYISFSF